MQRSELRKLDVSQKEDGRVRRGMQTDDDGLLQKKLGVYVGKLERE